MHTCVGFDELGEVVRHPGRDEKHEIQDLQQTTRHAVGSGDMVYTVYAHMKGRQGKAVQGGGCTPLQPRLNLLTHSPPCQDPHIFLPVGRPSRTFSSLCLSRCPSYQEAEVGPMS